jgi:hypothetical protein
VVTCPQCQERMVADRLADHLRYQHTVPKKQCDNCERPLERHINKGYGKRFCCAACQSANHRARVKALQALEKYKATRGLTTPGSSPSTPRPPPSPHHPREG